MDIWDGFSKLRRYTYSDIHSEYVLLLKIYVMFISLVMSKHNSPDIYDFFSPNDTDICCLNITCCNRQGHVLAEEFAAHWSWSHSLQCALHDECQKVIHGVVKDYFPLQLWSQRWERVFLISNQVNSNYSSPVVEPACS